MHTPPSPTPSRCWPSLAVLVTAGWSARTAVAQNDLVVPPLAANTEADGAELWAAGPFTARRQLVLPASWLAGAAGHSLTSLAMRRNQGARDPQIAGTLALEVVMAHS